MSEFPSASLVAQLVKNLPAKQETLGSIPGLGRSPGRVTGYPFQYSCLETPTERSLVGYSLLGHTELNTTERLSLVPLSLAQGLVHLRCPIKCLPPPPKKKGTKDVIFGSWQHNSTTKGSLSWSMPPVMSFSQVSKPQQTHIQAESMWLLHKCPSKPPLRSALHI